MDRIIKISCALLIFFILITFSLQGAYSKNSPIRLDWTSRLKSERFGGNKFLNFASPYVAGDQVFVGGAGKYFYAINLSDGKKVWETKLEGPILSKPFFDGSTVYIGDGEGYVYALNAADGEEIWKVYIGEEVMSSPAANDNTIFIGTQNDSIFALDKSSGSIKWAQSRHSPFQGMSIKAASDPVVIEGKVYVGNTDGVLVAYNAATGEKVLTLPVAMARAIFTDIDTSPLKYNGQLVFSTMEGALYSYDYKGMKEKWSKSIGTPNNIVYSGGLLYITAQGKVYCLQAESGETVWEKDLDVLEASQPAIAGNYIVIISTKDKLYLLDKTSGEVALERHLGGGTFGEPVVADGKILVLSNSNQLFSFKLQD